MKAIHVSIDTYGAGLAESLNKWFAELAENSNQGAGKVSIDAGEILEALLNSEDLQAWPKAAKRWLDEPMIVKIKAVAAVLATRRPPWEFRATARTVQFLDGVFFDDVMVFYEVNHVEKEVVVTAIDLPGPDGE